MTPRRRRSLSCALAAALLLPVLAAAAAPPAAAATTPAPPNLAGVWKYDEDVYFRIAQDPGGTSITTTIINDTCTSGPRGFMLTGSLDGVALNGTMQRCDEEDDILVTECGLNALWETPFTANVTELEIVGERRGEYYTWDTDANGSAVNCTLDYYFQAGFHMTRVDCGIKTFEQLAEHHIADASKRADEIALAQSFEDSGERLQWTDGQLAPGGFKEKVDALRALLVRFGYSATTTSAYRPILYQAHFADLYLCGLQLRDLLLANPELAPALAGSVAAINAEVGPAPGHAIVSQPYTVAGLTIKLPFVCWREPIAGCPHTNERGADVTVIPNNTRADWVGSMIGMCRPYLFKVPPDPPHWEYLGPDPFSTPKCSAVGRTGLIDLSISGNSPVNLLLEDSNGDRIGYDPVTQSAVNDFGSDSYYSGPGTQPQVIELSGYAASTGAYTVTGVGTGPGPYTVDFAASDFDGVVLDRGQVAGVASLGAPIATLNFTVRDDYSPPDVWTKASVLTTSGTSTSFAVESKNATHTVATAGGVFSGLMFSRQGNVIAIKDDGAGGSTRITVPTSLLSGDFEVRVDGAVVPHTRTADASGVTVTFNRPAGAEFITVEGASGTGSSSPSPPAGGDLTLILIVAVLAAVGVVGALVYISRRGRKQPGAPPGAPPGAGPPPAP